MMRNPFKLHEYFQVVRGAGLKKQHQILDLGCGKGFQTQVLARACNGAIGIDVAEQQITEAKLFLKHSCVEHKVRFLCTPLEKAGLPADSFDRIFSFCVLEHIPNLDEVLHELVRLLKPGGELHASVDALTSVRDLSLLGRHKRDHHVVQYFTSASLRRELQGAGLEVQEIFPIMTGEFARREFETRITQKDFSRGLLQRVYFYRRLVAEDRRSSRKEGIMLVCRARRPFADGEDV